MPTLTSDRRAAPAARVGRAAGASSPQTSSPCTVGVSMWKPYFRSDGAATAERRWVWQRKNNHMKAAEMPKNFERRSVTFARDAQ